MASRPDTRLRPLAPGDVNAPAFGRASSPINRTTTPLPPSTDRKSTASFIRRTLCPSSTSTQGASAAAPGGAASLRNNNPATGSFADQLSWDAQLAGLPPLTSSNEVDFELYAILAVMMREFVSGWYGKITEDAGFVNEVVTTVAHCSRAMEERARRVDWWDVLGEELPGLVEAHLKGTFYNGAGFAGFAGRERTELNGVYGFGRR